MVYLGVILGVGIMTAMIFMALDKKSSFPTRIAALIAIALMMITVVICVVIVLTDNRVPIDESVLIVGAPVEVKEGGSGNLMVILLLIVFLIGFFVLIVILAMRENRKHAKKDSGSIGGSGNSGGFTL